MQLLTEMGKNPKETMEKYGHNPEFREILEEFSKAMGNQFTAVADKKAEEAKQAEEKR